MYKKLSLSIIALVMVFFIGIYNQTFSQTASAPTKDALLKELIEIVDVKGLTIKMIDASTPAMEKMMEEQILNGMDKIPHMSVEERKNAKIAAKEALLSFGSIFERLKKRLDIGKLAEENAIEIYGKYYNEGELKDIIAFYKSPTGKKTLQLSPQIFQDSMIKMNEKMMPVIQEITLEMTKELVEKLKKSN